MCNICGQLVCPKTEKEAPTRRIVDFDGVQYNLRASDFGDIHLLLQKLSRKRVLVKKAKTAEEQQIMDERMAGIRKIRFEGRAARKAAQDATILPPIESLTIEETKNE